MSLEFNFLFWRRSDTRSLNFFTLNVKCEGPAPCTKRVPDDPVQTPDAPYRPFESSDFYLDLQLLSSIGTRHICGEACALGGPQQTIAVVGRRKIDKLHTGWAERY